MARLFAILLTLVGLVSPALAQTTRLAVGDAAPPLKIQEWVKGEPVTEFQRGRVYVVEFWATWCPPCKESIPHLTKLQETYKDQVTVIGISAKDGNGETIDKVRAFVTRAADTMAYTVAFDDGSLTNQAYMVAARRRGIPSAFVVDREGKVAWIGHPMDGLDAVLAKAVSGNLDVAADAKAETLAREIRAGIQAGKHDEAMARIDDLVALDPARYGQYATYKFAYLLTKQPDRAAAYAYARQASDGPVKENATVLAGMSETIIADPVTESRDLDLALDLARRAAAIAQDKDPGILETLARASFEKGLTPEAIEAQKRAIAIARPDKKPAMEKDLARYTSGQ